MAQYHLSAKVIGRAPTSARPRGGNIVAAAAYRAGERLRDERDGRTHDYRRKAEVVHREILAPADTPDWVHNRERLWNAVEASEKRKDAQLARDFVVALPIELEQGAAIALAREWVQRSLVDRGMIADFAIHWDEGNPHMHVLATMREIGPEAFGAKNRAWNDRALVDAWRGEWEQAANDALQRAGRDERIDRRTLLEQGITDREPTVHRGPNTHHSNRVERAIQDLSDELRRQERQACYEQELLEEQRAGNRISCDPGSREHWRSELLADRYKRAAADVVNTTIPRYWRVYDRGSYLELRNSAGVVRDFGSHIACVQVSAHSLDAMLRLAALKGWDAPKISGQGPFVEAALREALDRGFNDVRVDAQHQLLLERIRAENAARGYSPDGRVIVAGDVIFHSTVGHVVGVSADGRTIYVDVDLGRGDVVAIDRSAMLGERVAAGDRIRLDANDGVVRAEAVREAAWGNRDRDAGGERDRQANRDEPELE